MGGQNMAAHFFEVRKWKDFWREIDKACCGWVPSDVHLGSQIFYIGEIFWPNSR